VHDGERRAELVGCERDELPLQIGEPASPLLIECALEKAASDRAEGSEQLALALVETAPLGGLGEQHADAVLSGEERHGDRAAEKDGPGRVRGSHRAALVEGRRKRGPVVHRDRTLVGEQVNRRGARIDRYQLPCLRQEAQAESRPAEQLLGGFADRAQNAGRVVQAPGAPPGEKPEGTSSADEPGISVSLGCCHSFPRSMCSWRKRG
jgi:hypothetical protein